ncbi:hypothetical protein CLOL250_00390 [Clostridium sp. L2-50]|nr:hypothetical protein CLOL250_00390 [Clostridium sp. L2-50]
MPDLPYLSPYLPVVSPDSLTLQAYLLSIYSILLAASE